MDAPQKKQAIILMLNDISKTIDSGLVLIVKSIENQKVNISKQHQQLTETTQKIVDSAAQITARENEINELKVKEAGFHSELKTLDEEVRELEIENHSFQQQVQEQSFNADSPLSFASQVFDLRKTFNIVSGNFQETVNKMIEGKKRLDNKRIESDNITQQLHKIENSLEDLKTLVAELNEDRTFLDASLKQLGIDKTNSENLKSQFSNLQTTCTLLTRQATQEKELIDWEIESDIGQFVNKVNSALSTVSKTSCISSYCGGVATKPFKLYNENDFIIMNRSQKEHAFNEILKTIEIHLQTTHNRFVNISGEIEKQMKQLVEYDANQNHIKNWKNHLQELQRKKDNLNGSINANDKEISESKSKLAILNKKLGHIHRVQGQEENFKTLKNEIIKEEENIRINLYNFNVGMKEIDSISREYSQFDHKLQRVYQQSYLLKRDRSQILDSLRMLGADKETSEKIYEQLKEVRALSSQLQSNLRGHGDIKNEVAEIIQILNSKLSLSNSNQSKTCSSSANDGAETPFTFVLFDINNYIY